MASIFDFVYYYVFLSRSSRSGTRFSKLIRRAAKKTEKDLSVFIFFASITVLNLPELRKKIKILKAIKKSSKSTFFKIKNDVVAKFDATYTYTAIFVFN